METPQSFTARRSAASHLPTFQLPPPDLSNMHKYPGFGSSINTTSQPSPISIGNVLTPPASLPNEGLSPLSSSLNSGSSTSSAGGIPPYHPNSASFWTTQPNQSYTYSAPPQMPTPYASQNSVYGTAGGRQMYSPPSSYSARTSGSPTTSHEGLPPPYDLNLPSFSASASQSSGPQSNLPMLAPHQQQQQMQNALMNSQQPASQAPSRDTIHAPGDYGGRPPPTPTYSYAPISTPQQSNFPPYTQHSPPHHSPISAPPRLSQVSPNTSSMQQAYPRPYSSYALPAMSGPILSNVHSPGGQMALVGGMNMGGYPSHAMGQHMYQHPAHQQQQNDRPFKCDQCPQSFNRNHDLKRHKRIHLAVKPFPCGYCEKSFSRKDALKRHILVKGCGKPANNNSSSMTGSQSPVDKSEVMSDSTEDSPIIPKKEL